MENHRTHCVIVPTYNSGPVLSRTVKDLLNHWRPVFVVVDGSNDGSERNLQNAVRGDEGLEIIISTKNEGKGAAVLAGLQHAATRGMTHAAVFDSDGQHFCQDVPRFMRASLAHPDAMILGVPVFGEDAPSLRVKGRKAGNWWANLETLWGGINDSLFGFRVYPIEPSLQILRRIRGGRRFDFDTQLAVRLYWAGVRPLNLRTSVFYPQIESGGVSHFRYTRDNVLLVRVHTLLFLRSLALIPRLWRYRMRESLKEGG